MYKNNYNQNPTDKTFFKTLSRSFQNFKRAILIRTYWRGSSYKKFLHIIIVLSTATLVITGISTRISRNSNGSTVLFASAYRPANANLDTLQQGLGVQMVTKIDTEGALVSEYIIKEGDTLESVAGTFGVSKDSIKWSNMGLIDYYDEDMPVGKSIYIPRIPGVFYTVQEGDSLDSILSKTSGNKFEVIELNRLEAPSYSLAKGEKLLIPNGKLPPPPPKIPFASYNNIANNAGVNVSVSADYSKLKGIAFANPLSNPDCAGYEWSRGFTSPFYYLGHDGIDLSRGGGCPVRAAAEGTVTFAGWSNGGEGYNVRIDHGNGVFTLYYHGSGVFYQGVYPGARVSAGQEIMYMGNSGNSQGTHLHFSLRIDRVMVDATPYVPF